MKYIKLFEAFDDNEGFYIASDTTADELYEELDKRVEASDAYGCDSTFTGFVETIMTRSLMKAHNLDEKEAEKEASSYCRAIYTDTTSVDDEFDDYGRRNEGTAKLDGKLIFKWSSGGDGYGYSGFVSNEEFLLNDMKTFIQNWGKEDE